MKKILLSIVLVLSFEICLANQFAYITLSQFKEAQEYILMTKFIPLWGASYDDDVAEMLTTNNVNYKCDPCTEPFQFGNDNKINDVQEGKQTIKFIITDASTNGVDTTPDILEEEAFIVFYTVENDKLLYMSHVWPKHNAQSYGPMYSVRNETKKETHGEHKADVFDFDWLYIAGYEDKKGTAKVQLIQVYEPQGITYVLKIIPPTSEVISYKGYLESPVNFSAFE